VFIIILKFVLKKKDLYSRVVNIDLLFINNVEEDNRYKLEKLLNKRVTSLDNKDRKKKIVQYLIK
jgi:hypothetical protein